MKKTLSILSVLFAVMFITGCAGIQLTGAENVALKSAARIAGYKIAQNNPVLAAQALPYAKTLLASDSTQLANILWPAAVTLLLEKTNDPLLVATIDDVLILIEANLPPQEIKADNIKIALAAFVEGIELTVKQ
jgi:PBP1b-binding outer membrane lipoprotein LpoB